FELGASPRATIGITSAAKAHAFLQGRDYVKPDDVKAVAIPVLHHRIVLTSEARLHKEDIDRILDQLMFRVRVPKEQAL
ncbi:MAG: hypothetical protein J5941_03580, partial [Solobacterium sp.]|nr:hypothetical protein [Solobacterium sp.]